MKILYILDFPINTIGGSQKSTKTCLQAIEKQCGEVVLITKYCDNIENYVEETFEGKKVTVIYIKAKNKFLYSLELACKIKRIISEYDIDIINSQNPFSGIIIGVLKKMKYLRKKVVCIYTDRGFLSSYTNRRKTLLKFACYGLDAIICTTDINHEDWKFFTKKYKLHCDVFCIYNVLDDIWYNNSINKDSTIKELTVGFCARFDDFKRWDTVYDIINISKRDLFKFVIIIAFDNESQRIAAMNFIDEVKNTNKNIEIFTSLSELEVMSEFKKMDCFVLTSENESFGRTLIEAMLTYTIPIGTNAGGVPNVISSDENLFEVGDAETCVDILSKYSSLSKKELFAEKIRFYSYAHDKFSLQKFEDNLMKVYEYCLKRY